MSFRQICSVQCAVVLMSSLSFPALASGFYEQEDVLRLRLRNELRRADRPSAGDAHNIYAWVQGAALEYNSGYLGDIIGVDVGAFRVQKLDAHDDWSTRWYLDDHDSFNRYTAAVKVKLADNLSVKAGRMVTDSAYAGQEDIPLINSSSQRTLPTISDAVLVKYSATKDLDIYGMYRYGIYTYPDVSRGVHSTGPINPYTQEYDALRQQSVLSAVYRNKFDSYALSVSTQNDVASQVMGRVVQRYPTLDKNDGYFKPEVVGYYANLNGTNAKYDGPDKTYLLSGQLSYINKKGSLFAGLGKVGPKANRLAGIDTDLGYVFDLSIDRNYSDMWSWQVGGTWNLSPNTFVGIAEVFTDGYEDYQRNVRVQGMGTNILMGYMPQDGYLKGLRSLLVLNSSREQRDGSALGDRLDYFDIKMTIQYDFTLR